MNERKKKGLLTAVLALVAVVAIAVTAFAGTINQEEVDALLNTATDKAQVTSPFVTVANEVRESVVGVNNYQTISMNRYGFRYYGERQAGAEQLAGTGSGVVISQYGHVLTNYHVVKNAARLSVTYGSKEAEATVVAADEGFDVAVLLVPGLDLPAVKLGNSDEIQVGEWAIVVGNPLGQEYDRSVTVGIVSAFNRAVEGNSRDRYGRSSVVTNQMIQVDAAISSGNSGGGMFNILGQLQGIPTLKLDSSRMFGTTSIDNIGMCVPINAAKPLIREALEKYDSEKVEEANITDHAAGAADNADPDRPRMGVTITSLSSGFAQTVGLPNGAYVDKVDANSPAEAAGLKAGDIIVEVDASIIADHYQLVEKLAGYKIGDKAEVKYFRAEGLADMVSGGKTPAALDGDYHTTTVELKNLNESL